MSNAYGNLGVAPPKRTFLDGRAPPSASIADHAYLGTGVVSSSSALGGSPVGGLSASAPGPSGHGGGHFVPTRPQTSGAQPATARAALGGVRGGLSTAPNGSSAAAAEANAYNKMVVAPVPPSPASLSAQGAGPKTTEAVLLVEHKVELTDILHESLALLDNVYRTKQVFGDHLRYVDPSFSGDALHQMNLVAPPPFSAAYQSSIAAGYPSAGAGGIGIGPGGVGASAAGMGGLGGTASGGAAGAGPLSMGGSLLGSSPAISGGGPSQMGDSRPRADSGPAMAPQGTRDGAMGGPAGSGAAAAGVADPNSADGGASAAAGAAAAALGVAAGAGPSGDGSAGPNPAASAELVAQNDKLKQRLRTAEVFIKKLYNRTAQLDTEVSFYRDELRRMQSLCGLSRSPASALSVTDGHIPLNHPLYAPAFRRRCRSAPPTRTLLRTAIGGFGLRFPFPTSGGGGGGAGGADSSGAAGGLAHGGAGGGFATMSQNPFAKRRNNNNATNSNGQRYGNGRRRSGPFGNSSDDDGSDDSGSDGGGYGGRGGGNAHPFGGAAQSAYSIAATDAANAAVQGMRRRIARLTEAVVVLQHENGTLRAEKAARLTYRDALLAEYLVTRDRALAHVRASLQDALTKVNNPMRLLRARQPNPGTNPAVATNNIVLDVCRRLASEINALVGDIVTGGAAAVASTNAVLLGGSGAALSGGPSAGLGLGGAGQRDPLEGDYEEVRGIGMSGAGLDALRGMGMDGTAGKGGVDAMLRPPTGGGHQRPTGPRGGAVPPLSDGASGGRLGVGALGSRPGTSGGGGIDAMGGGADGGGGSGPVGNSRRVSGAASAGDDGGGYGYDGTMGPFAGAAPASVVPSGGNNYILTCHGCGTCVPLISSSSNSGGSGMGSASTSAAPTIAVVGGGAGLALINSALGGSGGGGSGADGRRGGAGGGGVNALSADADALYGALSDDGLGGILALSSAPMLSGGASPSSPAGIGGGGGALLLGGGAGQAGGALGGAGGTAGGGGPSGGGVNGPTAAGVGQYCSAASLPIGCPLSQSAARRRELLTRLRPIVEALPLQRRKQLLHLMCELRHLFDCLVLSHRTLLSRYDDDRKEAHRQAVQLQVDRSLLRDQISELEGRLAAITAAAQRQEHAIQQAALAARGY